MTPADKHALQAALERCTASPSVLVAALAETLTARLGAARAVGLANALAIACTPHRDRTGGQ